MTVDVSTQPRAELGFKIVRQRGASYYRVNREAMKSLPDTSDNTPIGPFSDHKAALDALMTLLGDVL